MEFEGLLGQFLSNTNEVRRQAEATINQLRQSQNDQLALELLKVIRTSPAVALRALAAVLLRKVAMHCVADQHGWDALADSTKGVIKAEMLLAVSVETDDSTRHKICDTLAEIAVLVLSHIAWPELWSFLYSAAVSDVLHMQEASLLLFEMLSGYIASHLQEHFPMFQQIFVKRMLDPAGNDRVRTAAARAATGLITCLPPNSGVLDGFAEVLRHVIATFLASVTSDQALELASVLIDVAEDHPTLFRAVLTEVVATCCSITNNSCVTNDLRRLAFEIVVTLGENAPGMCRKLPDYNYLRSTLPICLSMLTEHGVEPMSLSEWESADGQDAADEFDLEGNNVSIAEECLCRIGRAIKPKTTLPVLFPLISGFLSRSGLESWKYRFAGLSALSQVADLLGDEPQHHQQAAGIVCAYVNDAHPRVRHVAIGAIGNLCHCQGPLFQTNTAPTIVPAMLTGLSDSCRRVRGQAALAVAQFTTQLMAEVDDAIIQPYLNDLLKGLFVLLSSSDEALQEYSITAVSALAEVGRQLIAPYYDLVMPRVQQILSASDVPSPAVSPAAAGRRVRKEYQRRVHHAQMMKGRALECLTVIGDAVGPDRFHSDALAAMQGIVTLLHHSELTGGVASQGRRDDDPFQSFLWEAVARIAKTIGPSHFSPYLPLVMPSLLAGAGAPTIISEVTIGQTDDSLADGHASDDCDEDDIGEYTEGENGHTLIRVRTAALDDKLSAVGSLGIILHHLRGPVMAPYCPSILAILVPLLRETSIVFDDLRSAAASMFEDVCVSAVSITRSDEVMRACHGSGVSAVDTIFQTVSEIVDAFVAAIKSDNDRSEVNVELQQTWVTCLHHTVKEACSRSNYSDSAAHAGGYVPLISVDKLREITQTLLVLRQGAVQRRAVRKAEMTVNPQDYDEEMMEEVDMQESADAELQFYIIEALGTLIKTHVTIYMPVYTSLVAPVIRDMYHSSCLPVDRRNAIFVIDDILEFVGDSAIDTMSGTPYSLEYLGVLCRCAVDPDPAIRQAAVFGIGSAANSCRVTFARYLGSCLAALSSCLQSSRAGERGQPEDNAVTALGKIIVHQYASPAMRSMHPELPPRSSLMSLFVGCLPLKVDVDEARVAIQMLCTFVMNADSDLIGAADCPNAEAIHRILSIFAATFTDAKVVNDALKVTMLSALKMLQESLPATFLSHVWTALDEKDRMVLITQAASGLPVGKLTTKLT